MSIKTFIQAAEIYRNATRPAILASIREVLGFYGMIDKFDEIYFNGEAEVSNFINSDKDSKLRSDRATDLINRQKLFVTAEINRSVFNSGYGNSGTSPNNPYVWKDEDSRTYLYPGFEGRDIVIECNCHFRTRNEAQGFVNRIERTRSRQLSEFTFNANIHYPINIPIIEFLSGNHQRLKQAGIVSNEYPEWFFEHAVAPMGVIHNEGNNHKTIVVKREIIDTNIIFDESEVGLSRKGDYAGQYIASFRYKFYWQDMVEWQLHYPIMVYQQPIDTKWLPTMQHQYINGFIQNAFLEYQQGNLVFKNRQASSPFYYRFPDNDPWYPPQECWLDKQVSLLLMMEDVENKALFNIKEIPNWTWKDAVIKHIIKYREYLFTRHEDIVHIKLYSDDLQVLDEQLSMDEDGNVYMNRRPTMKNVYRAVIYIDLDLKNLSPEAIERIINDEEYQKEFLPGVFPWHNWKVPPNDGDVSDNKGGGKWNPEYPDDERWIVYPDDWYSHADSEDMGDGLVRFSPVLYQLNLNLLAYNNGK